MRSEPSRLVRLAPSLVLGALIGATLLAACATPEGLPPLTARPSSEWHPGKFVWFDLLSENPAAARSFYSEVFGWRFDAFGADGDDAYYLIRNGDVVIGGLARLDGDDADVPQSLWLPTLSVEDVDAAAALAKGSGGQVLRQPEDFPGRGRIAAVRDPNGATLLLLRSDDGDPPDRAAPVGAWLWTDLWTPDAAEAKGFYAALAGFEARDIEASKEHVYHVFGRDGRARAGMVELLEQRVDPNWLPYVRVADVDETVRRAEAHGGRVLLRSADVAVLMDPAGAAVGVQRHRRLAEATR